MDLNKICPLSCACQHGVNTISCSGNSLSIAFFRNQQLSKTISGLFGCSNRFPVSQPWPGPRSHHRCENTNICVHFFHRVSRARWSLYLTQWEEWRRWPCGSDIKYLWCAFSSSVSRLPKDVLFNKGKLFLITKLVSSKAGGILTSHPHYFPNHKQILQHAHM